MDKSFSTWAARWRVPLGFALGIAYLVFCQPTSRLMLYGGALAFAGLVLRAWAAGHLDKNQQLAASGPYRYTRNPLYLGSFLMGAGFALAGNRWQLGLAFLVFFLAIYVPVMRREEAELRALFGEAFDSYARAVPPFLPSGRRAPASGGAFMWRRYFRNREYQAALGFAAGFAFLFAKTLLA
jgi:protein-S-isoprenylcysteine O-methyltransferase Ste14